MHAWRCGKTKLGADTLKLIHSQSHTHTHTHTHKQTHIVKSSPWDSVCTLVSQQRYLASQGGYHWSSDPTPPKRTQGALALKPVVELRKLKNSKEERERLLSQLLVNRPFPALWCNWGRHYYSSWTTNPYKFVQDTGFCNNGQRNLQEPWQWVKCSFFRSIPTCETER